MFNVHGNHNFVTPERQFIMYNVKNVDTNLSENLKEDKHDKNHSFDVT